VSVRRAGIVLAGLLALLSAKPAKAGDAHLLPACVEGVAHYLDGELVGWLCEEEALDRGLTIIDLGNLWTPASLRSLDGDSGPDYRETYLALASAPNAATDLRARELSLYGVFPSVSAVVARLRDTHRHECHLAVDDGPMAKLTGRLVEERKREGRKRIRSHTRLRANLKAQARRRDLESIADLAQSSPYYRRQLLRLEKKEARTKVIRAVQEHLRCDGDLSEIAVDGVLSWHTTHALRVYQRRYFLAPTAWIDLKTITNMENDSRSNDWRSLLRVLRERVAHATALIEDGSAINKSALVVEQLLDPTELVWPRGYSPEEGGAPDLIGRATDHAARQLGWTGPEKTLEFAARHSDPARGKLDLRVAVMLPPIPSYHGAHMELRVVIEPGARNRLKTSAWSSSARRPVLLLYVNDKGRDLLLARWPTTVGGWQDEQLASGALVQRFKGSEHGSFVWKSLYLAPRWLPPERTPDKDVLRRSDRGDWRLDKEILGPSFRSAFGLAMLVNHRPYLRRGEILYADQGIRVHGTGNILSLARGTSHGCHRLLGYQVMRLTSFLLAHRSHQRAGPERVRYKRVFRTGGQRFPVAIDQRGYRFDLTPPVPVEVRE
jgi:hypothetical protein